MKLFTTALIHRSEIDDLEGGKNGIITLTPELRIASPRDPGMAVDLTEMTVRVSGGKEIYI